MTMAVNVSEILAEVLGCIWLQKTYLKQKPEIPKNELRDCLKVSISAEEEGTHSEETLFSILVSTSGCIGPSLCLMQTLQYSACWLTEKLLQELVAEFAIIFLNENRLTTSNLHAAPQTSISIGESGEGFFACYIKVITTKSKMLTQCIGISKWLHRIKIVQPQVIVTLSVNVCEKYEDTFGETDDKWKVLEKNKMLITSIHHYISKEYAEYFKLKLKVGNPVELASQKFSSGEPIGIQMTPVAALLTPTENTTMFSKVAIFAYCPAICPMFECQDLTFFEEPQTLAKWNEFHQEPLLLEKNRMYVEVYVLYKHFEAELKDNDVQRLTIVLRRIAKKKEEDQNELTSSLHDLRVLFKNTMQKLPDALKLNQSNIKKAIHDTLEKVLVFHKRHNKMLIKATIGIPLLAESLHGIVASSTDQQFRERNFTAFKCTNSQDLMHAVQDTLIDIAGSSMGIDKAKLKAAIIPDVVPNSSKTDGQHKVSTKLSATKNDEDVQAVQQTNISASDVQDISGNLAPKCENTYFPMSDMLEERFDTKAKKMCFEKIKHDRHEDFLPEKTHSLSVDAKLNKTDAIVQQELCRNFERQREI